MRSKRSILRLAAGVIVTSLLFLGGQVLPAAAAGGPNLAAGKAVAASSTNGTDPVSGINDGNQDSYWESANNALPQWAQVDLGSSTPIDEVQLELPASWGARTQTLSLQGSADGVGFSTLVTSAARTFDPSSGNTVTIDFPASTTRFVRVNVTANTGWPAGQLSELAVYAATSSSSNLARGRTLTASSSTSPYTPANANDGNQGSYWESAGSAFPQWLRVDLGTAVAVDKLVLKLPASPDWATRTQTLSVQGSTDGSAFSDLVAAAGYSFNPATGNTVTITFNPTTTRYLRLDFTANTGWPAAQLAEFEVYGPNTGDVTAPSAPTDLVLSQPVSGQVRLTWGASSDNVGVAGYDVYANGVLRTSVAGSVLTYTDSQPDTATVTYFVRAKDAAGNQSANSNSVTRTGTTPTGTDQALGKPITASSTTQNFVAANANDGDLTTYWEGAGNPSTLTVSLGANVDTSSVVVALNPSTAWGTRTQTIAVFGREQSATSFTQLSPATPYTFNPATGNTVTIPVSGRVADVRLTFSANSGAGGGQAAEFQVIGVPGPNPDLTVSGVTASPAAPVETDQVTLGATVRNIGTTASAATTVTFYLGTTKVGTAPVGAVAAGGSTTVTANIGARNAGSYQLTARVDEAGTVVEQNETNNSLTSPTPLVVKPVDSSDLVASPVGWSPGNPSAGNNVTFTVAIKNQGTVASGSGAHGITLTLADATTGSAVRTLTGSFSGTIAAGATTAPVSLGSWTAVNGKYTVTTALAVDTNELAVKQANNTSSRSLFVGRGANMPYDSYEAEDGVTGGGAQVIGPNRTVGDLAGEASGRKAVTLNATGQSVSFTTRASTNSLVVRYSIPDAPGGGGINSTLDVYVNGTFLKAIALTSKYAWLYGAETGPGNSPGAGGPRHIYDEASMLLGTTVPAGSTLTLQKDAANGTSYAIDFVNTEQATAIADPDPATYVVPAGFTQQDVQNALDTARQDTTKLGVYLPPGDYQTAQKFQVFGRALKVVGAGPWYTRFHTPDTQENTDAGFRADATANGSTFSGFAFLGNYTSRIDGPGKVFDLSGVSGMTIDNIWVEHTVCMYWGTNTDSISISNSRIRDTFADGINMTNGSTDNHVFNNESRATGDDSFALFSAIDAGGADEKNNVYENLSSLLTWRAAGIAVYGGFNNTFRNIYIADTLVYAGITVSSLDFGIPMNGFGTIPTNIQNVSIVRSGGHFWNGQTFPGIWLFSASKVFQGIRISDVDILSPTYSGIMFQTNYVGGQPQNPITDTVLTGISITGAHRSGDAFDAKSGFGLWANELPEAGQGPAVGSVTFNGLHMSDNFQDIKNTTSTFTITVNN